MATGTILALGRLVAPPANTPWWAGTLGCAPARKLKTSLSLSSKGLGPTPGGLPALRDSVVTCGCIGSIIWKGTRETSPLWPS